MQFESDVMWSRRAYKNVLGSISKDVPEQTAATTKNPDLGGGDLQDALKELQTDRIVVPTPPETEDSDEAAGSGPAPKLRRELPGTVPTHIGVPMSDLRWKRDAKAARASGYRWSEDNPQEQMWVVNLYRLNWNMQYVQLVGTILSPFEKVGQSEYEPGGRAAVILMRLRGRFETLYRNAGLSDEEAKPILDAFDEWRAEALKAPLGVLPYGRYRNRWNEDYTKMEPVPAPMPDWHRFVDWLDELRDLTESLDVQCNTDITYDLFYEPFVTWSDWELQFRNVEWTDYENTEELHKSIRADTDDEYKETVLRRGYLDTDPTSRHRMGYVLTDEDRNVLGDRHEVEEMPGITAETLRRRLFYAMPETDVWGYMNYIPKQAWDKSEDQLREALRKRRAGQDPGIRLVAPVTFTMVNLATYMRMNEAVYTSSRTKVPGLAETDENLWRRPKDEGHSPIYESIMRRGWYAFTDTGGIRDAEDRTAFVFFRPTPQQEWFERGVRKGRMKRKRAKRKARKENSNLPRRNRFQPDPHTRTTEDTEAKYIAEKAKKRKKNHRSPRVGNPTGVPKSTRDTRNKPPQTPATGMEYLPDFTIEVPKDNPWFTD
ncbi:hypothetical protein G1C97_0444 [Bifidobacterium sp. DSM 109959]|uniref:Uncharacterized protein n=1 Tax=Bifidobacterium olomucense TaxID=2675324 RepID=A0A7Y0EW26_9BIFI|nr:hypothetical protein [Bifidobacterium sp. DSM 109959]